MGLQGKIEQVLGAAHRPQRPVVADSASAEQEAAGMALRSVVGDVGQDVKVAAHFHASGHPNPHGHPRLLFSCQLVQVVGLPEGLPLLWGPCGDRQDISPVKPSSLDLSEAREHLFLLCYPFHPEHGHGTPSPQPALESQCGPDVGQGLVFSSSCEPHCAGQMLRNINRIGLAVRCARSNFKNNPHPSPHLLLLI